MLSRLARHGLVFALTAGCGAKATKSEPSSAPSAAQGLPAFDISGDEASAERFFVELGDAPVKGNPKAPVTIVMFSDFECPYCKKAHELVTAIEAKYGDKVRFAYKAYPLDIHDQAMPAAMAARSAQAQGKFWPYHDLLFSQGGLDVPRLKQYATTVGFDGSIIDRDLESLEFGPEVSRDLRQGRKLGVNSTPYFFVNGRPIRGAKPLEQFDEVIAQELQAADKLKRSGVPEDQIYAKIIEDGFKAVKYSRREGLDPDSVIPVPIGDSPVQGPATAPVTIVAFGDFQCPFCSRGHRMLHQVKQRYGDKLRIVYKHNPLSFHSHAFIAARAAMAAHAQGKFWQYHDALYEKNGKFEESDLLEVARQIKLDIKAFQKAMHSTQFDEAINRDQELAMMLQARGTPVYFINGRPLEGAQPELSFRLLIEEELERAKALLDKGVRPEQLYDSLAALPLDEGG